MQTGHRQPATPGILALAVGVRGIRNREGTEVKRPFWGSPGQWRGGWGLGAAFPPLRTGGEERLR